MSIIGISGKIGSGKDTVGHIIQYLVAKVENGYTSPDTENDLKSFIVNKHINHSIWQIKKFADKLKECVSIILNIPRADLELSEVKNKVLGEEWIRYGYADGFIRKYIGNGNMGEPIMNNKQCSKEKYEEERRTNWQTAYKQEYTVRDILILLGTEVGRQIHDDFWVNALFSEYETVSLPDETTFIKDENKYIRDRSSNWIITDMRFSNELKAIEDRKGITIRCNRVNSQMQSTEQVNHISETSLDNAHFDYVLDNNGTIDELIKSVKEILIDRKII